MMDVYGGYSAVESSLEIESGMRYSSHAFESRILSQYLDMCG